MANDHPFQSLFESFGRFPASHADSVNRKAYGELLATLDVEMEKQGRCILLRAPRAGHGKTHLLSRVQHQLGASHEFIPLHPSGSRVSAISVTEDTLNRLGRALPAAGGLTMLDLVIRRLFSFALQPLVISGEVPCQDREGALSALRNRPIETFDFHHPNAVTAQWARENFEVLGPRLSMELAQRCGLPVREISFWVNAFFRYAATPLDHPSRAAVLGMEVAGEPVTESVAMERLTSLLALVSLLMRVVVVADDLEGFSADETAALAFAAFIGAVRQHSERVDVIISLNKDVWENAFKPRLSGGLADRLSEVLIELEPLSDEDIVALFDSRAPGLGKEVFDRIDPSDRHARGLIREAGKAWMNAVNERARPASQEKPAVSGMVSDESTQDEEPPAEEPSDSEPVAEEEEETFASEPVSESPVSSFAPVFEEPVASSAIEDIDEETGFTISSEAKTPRTATPPAQQWGGGSVYDAQILDEAVKEEPFGKQVAADFLNTPAPSESVEQPSVAAESSFQSPPPAFQVASPYFQPVAPDEPVPPPATLDSSVFQPVFDSESPGSETMSPAFEPNSPGAGFGPPPPPVQPTGQPGVEDDDRVDDLLKQFRERYGR